MNYDIFEAKVKKLADFIKLMVKHLIKVAIAAAILLAIITALLIAKGIILSSESCPTEIEYGEELEYKVRAFLSRVYYEYYDEDSGKWTKERPIVPGDYQVRAVTNATIGHRYGSVYDFSIVPLSIDVKVLDSSLVYGDTPTVTANTAYGDRIECDYFTYSEDMNYITPDVASVRIYDSEGNDVTDRYTIRSTRSRVNLLPRPITVESESDEKVYDGREFSASGYEITDGSLAYKDRIVLTFNTSVTDVGVYDNDMQIQIIDDRGNDVTHNYDIRLNPGELKITKRPITIRTETAEMVYDSIPRYFEDDSVVGEYDLCTGHRLSGYDRTQILDCGKYENEASFDIYDRYGGYCTDNYDITVEYGEVVVTKRAITVATATESFTYTGEYFSDTRLYIDGLGENDYTEVLEFTEVKDAGRVDNDVKFKINHYSGGEATDNYDITYELGTLTVKQRPITIYSDSASLEYNGLVQTVETFSYYCDAYWIFDTHEIKVVSATEVKDITDWIDNEISVKIYVGDEDVTDNFKIEYVFGDIRVTKRTITVYTPSIERYFDRQTHYATEAEVYNLSEIHSFKVLESTGLCYPGWVVNTFKKYDILDSEGNSVLENYIVNFVNGSITVYERPVTAITGSAEKVYDGSPLTAPFWQEGDSGEFGLLPGDYIVADAPYGSQTEVGSSPNYFDYYNTRVKIFDEGGNDVTFCYNITRTEGTLTVKPRPITVITDGGRVKFDDRDHTWSGFELQPGAYGLSPGDKLELDTLPVFRYVSDSGENALTVRVKNGETDVSGNYEISYKCGKVEIIPRDISISTNSISEMYNDVDYYDHTVTVTGGYGLCSDHYILVDTSSAIFHDAIRNAENTVSFGIYRDGEDMTANYNITASYGSVNIEKRPINLSTNSFSGEYDGLDHGGKLTLAPGGMGLCTGHELKITKAPVFKDVCFDEINRIEFSIVKGEEDVTANYAIDVTYGIINITHRTVYIITGSQTWFYDGEPHSCKDYQTVNSSFVSFHSVKVPISTIITEVGSEYNNMVFHVFDEDEIAVTYNYHIEIVEYGIIEIVEDQIPDTPTIPDGPLPDGPDDLLGGGDGEGNGDGEGDGEGEGDGDGEGDGEGDGDMEGEGEGTIIGIGGGGGPLSESGQIGLGPLPEGDGILGEGQMVTAYYVFSSTGGQVYLKLKSFGDFSSNAWLEADAYDLYFEDFSAFYLTSKALEEAGRADSFMRITSVFNQYVLPYYATTVGGNIQQSDVRVNGDASSEYSLTYYSWNFSDGMTLPAEYIEFEKKYSEFVHSRYTKIDDETLAYMKGIIEAQGFDPEDPQVIYDVAKYIQNAATYNLFYDRALDSTPNVAIAFLDEYKEGVCQHYATAATLLFRALGLPARYTIGYVGTTIAGEITEIMSNQGHAWVEVYIDGLGWIQVEVTGSGFDMGEGDGEGDFMDETIKIEPTYQFKEYDGTPLYAENKISELDPVLSQLLALGYTYEVTVGGELYGVGTAESYIISFELYDPNGNPVTDKFTIEYGTGILEMKMGVIEIYLYEKWYEYNGTSYSYGLNDYAVISKPENAELRMNGINISMKQVGMLTSNDINENIGEYFDYNVFVDGVDQTENYLLVVVSFIDGGEYTPMKITAREITVTTASESKHYDGKPLSNDGFFISKGQLCEGHTLYLDVIGSTTDVGTAHNTVDKSSLVILDDNGVNVTENYSVTLALGTLTVL